MSTFWIIVLIVLAINHISNTLQLVVIQSDNRNSLIEKIIGFILQLFLVPLFLILFLFEGFWEWNTNKQTLFAQSISLVRIWWRYIIRKKTIGERDYQPTLGRIRFYYQHWERNGIKYNNRIKHQALKIYLISMNRYKQQLKDVEILQNAINKTNNG